jgi:glycosyltransferase involved in cell wall biosynthesis
MKVWLYCVCRNEAVLMPYVLRHYAPWVDKLIFYDAGSDDGTREMIAGCRKAELRNWAGIDALADDELWEFSNTQWKEARGHADWVAWIDADEILYHPRILEVLQNYSDKGVTVPMIDGYTMVSGHEPTSDGQIYDEIKTGFRDAVWGKRVLFNPEVAMQFNPGRHSINVDGFSPVSSLTADIKLLHYRALGLDYLKARHARNWARVPERCRQRNYGVNCEPLHDGHHGVRWFEEMMGRTWPEVI